MFLKTLNYRQALNFNEKNIQTFTRWINIAPPRINNKKLLYHPVFQKQIRRDIKYLKSVFLSEKDISSSYFQLSFKVTVRQKWSFIIKCVTIKYVTIKCGTIKCVTIKCGTIKCDTINWVLCLALIYPFMTGDKAVNATI